MRIFTKSNIAAICVTTFGLLSANAHGQQVALLDSGVDPDAGYNIVPGFNYFLNIDDTSDVSQREGEGHGTVSVRLVTESFSGGIVPFVIDDGTNLAQSQGQAHIARDSALSDILGRDAVRVIGITTGIPGVAGSAAPLLPQLSNANKVIAIHGGNDTASQPNALSSSSFNLAGVIIVGGTDADGNFLAATNRAGTTANKYVAAIGLPSLDDPLGGSSWATARIAGIAGAVLQQNPDLTAAEVVDVILLSAEDRGETGTDSEYGRGFIRNAEQVLNNVIGPVVVPTDTGGDTGGGGGGGGGAALLVGGALAGALLLSRKSSTKLEKTLVLDSYGRAFQVDLNEHVSISDEATLHLDEFFHALDQTSVGDGFALPSLNTHVAFGATTNSNDHFDMIKYFGMADDVVLVDEAAEVSVALRSQLTKQVELEAGFQVSPSQAFGGVSQLDSHDVFGTSSFISGQAFSSVLSGFSTQGQTASLAYTPSKSKKTTLKLGMVSVDQAQQFGQDSFSTIIEGAYQFSDNASMSLQFGQIEERGSLFGGAAGGIFGVNTADTYAINIAGRIKASEKFSIVANYGVGRTSVDASANSVLKDFSSLRTDWYSLGLIGNNVIRSQDQLGIAYSQPLKVRSGAVDYSLPVGRQANGDIRFDNERVNLSDSGATEHSLEGYYRTMLSNKVEVGSFIAYRQNPNHVNDQGDDVLIMATLRFRH